MYLDGWFALNSTTNTLPTPDNLRRLNKRVVSKCPLCSNTGTLEHILNFCSISLNQGRFTWRHNSVLNHITKTMIDNKPENLEIFADICGLSFNGGTIPPDVVSTQLKPDLVLLNRQEKKIFVMELTCSFERNITAANLRKTTKYTNLKSDLEDQGYSCTLVPFEIGSRGYVTTSNRRSIVNIFAATKIKTNALKCIKELSKISLLCSYSIFNAYTQPSWRDPPYLTPWIVWLSNYNLCCGLCQPIVSYSLCFCTKVCCCYLLYIFEKYMCKSL